MWEQITVAAIVFGMLVVKGFAILALVYLGARLAIRDERRANSNR